MEGGKLMRQSMSGRKEREREGESRKLRRKEGQ
jgi:hypothetical protein